VLPWLAAERPALFNAYQQIQTGPVARTMRTLQGTGQVASFIGHAPGKALFVGVYTIGAATPRTRVQDGPYVELTALGMRVVGEADLRATPSGFELSLTDVGATWKGKLIVEWPPPERSWWRRAHRTALPILAILEDSALEAAMPAWEELVLTWDQLRVLPTRWKTALAQWRGIYYICDTSDGKGYVGSAAGADNLLGRWLNYAAQGHGGNHLLRPRDPRTFQFSILQRVGPDMEPNDVVRVERSWKARLRTRAPYGLNEN
jgi:hypothetical protein